MGAAQGDGMRTAKYLRAIGTSREWQRDPTMSHVVDPSLFHVGDYIRDDEGYDRIVAIDDAVFGSSDTRLAHLVACPRPGRRATIHDMRKQQDATK